MSWGWYALACAIAFVIGDPFGDFDRIGWWFYRRAMADLERQNRIVELYPVSKWLFDRSAGCAIHQHHLELIRRARAPEGDDNGDTRSVRERPPGP